MVDGLILVGSGLSGFEAGGDPPQQWDDLVKAWNAGNTARVSELEVQIWVDGPQRALDEVDSSFRDRVREMNMVALTNEAAGSGKEHILEPPAVDRLSEIHVPTLVVVGDLDQPNMQVIADRLVSGTAGAQKVVMSGTAHVPNMEQPVEFNRLVLGFLDNH